MRFQACLVGCFVGGFPREVGSKFPKRSSVGSDKLGRWLGGESHQLYSIKPTKKIPFLVCLYVKKIKIGKKYDIPLFKTDIFPKKNDGWKMKLPF